MKRKSLLFFFIAVILITSFFVSCKKAQQKTDGPVEIIMWGGSETAHIHETVIEEFNRRNPNIKATLAIFGEQLRDLIKPALNSGEGPDFFGYDTGPGYLGVLVSSGLALDLTPYSEKYRWNTRFLDWALTLTTYNDRLFGIANEVEMLGVFYNKKMFSDLNLTPPNNTYQEFLDICKKLESAGILPVLLDDRDQWPGFHYESIWMNTFAGPQKVKDALASKIKWTDPDLILGMEKFSEFARSSYVNKQINGLGYDDANAMFYAGASAMRVTGTWMVERMVDNMGDNVGFFYMPPVNSSIPAAPPGGFGGAMVINGKTKYPDETAAFLDFYFSDFSTKLWYEAGYIPSVANFDYNDLNLSPLFKDVLNEINSADELGTNIDVLAGPRVNEAAQNYVQQLIDGSTTSARAMEIKQKAQEDDIAAGDV